MKKAKKKGTPRAKKPSGRRSAPSKKPLRLKVGKTYESEDATIAVKILSISGGVAIGVFTRSDVTRWVGTRDKWILCGFWATTRKKGNLSLVREVPSPKSPKGRVR